MYIWVVFVSFLAGFVDFSWWWISKVSTWRSFRFVWHFLGRVGFGLGFRIGTLRRRAECQGQANRQTMGWIHLHMMKQNPNYCSDLLCPSIRPLRILARLLVNLSVVLFSVVFSLEAMGAPTTARLILAIEWLFCGGRMVHHILTSRVMSAGAGGVVIGV